MPELISAKELAKRLHVTRDTVHDWRRRGLIPALRAGRRTIRFDVMKVFEALAHRGNESEVTSD